VMVIGAYAFIAYHVIRAIALRLLKGEWP